MRIMLTAGALIALGWWIEPAMAVTFGKASVGQDSMIAVAVPHDSGYYSLLVLEQISSEKACWKESGSSPTQVEPLLLNFNFTHICGRSTDSNGYSLRIAEKDIGMDYRLSLQKRGNDLVLVGLPRSSQAPSIEVGRTRGIRPGLLKIVLGPGWQFAKRTYSGRTLGHIYFSRAAPVYTARTVGKPLVQPRHSKSMASAKPLVATNPPNSSFNAKGALSGRSDTVASSKPIWVQPCFTSAVCDILNALSGGGTCAKSGPAGSNPQKNAPGLSHVLSGQNRSAGWAFYRCAQGRLASK